jgi:hypothetical protein
VRCGFDRAEATIEAGNYTGALSLRAFGSNKVIKAAPLDTSGSDLGQLPYCYMTPSAKLAVKPINWSLRSNLNGAHCFPSLHLWERPVPTCWLMIEPDGQNRQKRVKCRKWAIGVK